MKLYLYLNIKVAIMRNDSSRRVRVAAAAALGSGLHACRTYLHAADERREANQHQRPFTSLSQSLAATIRRIHLVCHTLFHFLASTNMTLLRQYLRL